MRTGTPIGKNYVTLCIERIFAEEPRQVDHKYAILRNQQHPDIAKPFGVKVAKYTNCSIRTMHFQKPTQIISPPQK